MPTLELRPTHKPVQTYYAALRQFDDLGVSHEGAVKSVFPWLLYHCARLHDWTLVPEWEVRRPRRASRSAAVCKAPAVAHPKSANSEKDFQPFLCRQRAAAEFATTAALHHIRAVSEFQERVPELARSLIDTRGIGQDVLRLIFSLANRTDLAILVYHESARRSPTPPQGD